MTLLSTWLVATVLPEAKTRFSEPEPRVILRLKSHYSRKRKILREYESYSFWCLYCLRRPSIISRLNTVADVRCGANLKPMKGGFFYVYETCGMRSILALLTQTIKTQGLRLKESQKNTMPSTNNPSHVRWASLGTEIRTSSPPGFGWADTSGMIMRLTRSSLTLYIQTCWVVWPRSMLKETTFAYFWRWPERGWLAMSSEPGKTHICCKHAKRSISKTGLLCYALYSLVVQCSRSPLWMNGLPRC